VCVLWPGRDEPSCVASCDYESAEMHVQIESSVRRALAHRPAKLEIYSETPEPRSVQIMEKLRIDCLLCNKAECEEYTYLGLAN